MNTEPPKTSTSRWQISESSVKVLTLLSTIVFATASTMIAILAFTYDSRLKLSQETAVTRAFWDDLSQLRRVNYEMNVRLQSVATNVIMKYGELLNSRVAGLKISSPIERQRMAALAWSDFLREWFVAYDVVESSRVAYQESLTKYKSTITGLGIKSWNEYVGKEKEVLVWRNELCKNLNVIVENAQFIFMNNCAISETEVYVKGSSETVNPIAHMFDIGEKFGSALIRGRTNPASEALERVFLDNR